MKRLAVYCGSSMGADPAFAETAQAAPDPALRVTLLQALGELPPQDRAVLVLRYWEDRSAEETAAVLRLSPSTVRSRSSRALARMRAVLGEDLEDPGDASA